MLNAHELSQPKGARASVCTILSIAALALLTSPVVAQVTWEDVNPDFTDTHGIDPDRASGGRVNRLAIEAGNNSVMYAASEWGGMYKSTDAGLTWGRLDGHLPVAAWDVEIDPGNPSKVYATSFFDGKAASVSGINVSSDGGATWTHPASANPPAGFCQNLRDETELTAFGISVHPTNNAIVYIGTSCGLAKSTDAGATWEYIDPSLTPGTATRVWDVIARPGGVVHVCGNDGYLRSDNGGTSWVQGTGLPGGRCNLAMSPDEDYVLLAAVGTSIYETTNANSATPMWTQTRQNLSPQGRVPFVETNQRSDNGADNVFDLWFGDVSLWRVGCTTPTPPAPGGAPRCGTANVPAWAGPFTRTVGGHDDMGDVIFDSEAANDACPVLMSSDGGVYFNADSTADCHNPNWDEPNVTPHGLWPFSMSGNDRPGAAEDLYFGNQDNGLFGTIDISDPSPTWHNELCCDGFDTAGDDDGAIFSICCFGGGGRSTQLVRTQPGFVNGATVTAGNYPPGGLLPTFNIPDSIVRYNDSSYVLITRDCTVGAGGCLGADGGVFITDDIDAGSVTWTELGNATEPPTNQVCGVQVGVNGGGTPTFYVQTGDCDQQGAADRMFRYTGTAPGNAWTEITLPAGGFGFLAANPSNPNRLIASGQTGTDAAMFSSTDGGTTWTAMPALDALMNGGGDFPMRNFRGPSRFTGFNGYWQPSFAAFDPDTPTILAGGQDSGVFMSTDDGANWTLVSDPRTSDTSGTPHIPRPRYGYFDTEGGVTTFYIGSQGRGIWRGTVGVVVDIFADNFESGDTSAWSATIP